MPWLFDTDAISELLRKRPAPGYVDWLAGVPRVEQYTSKILFVTIVQVMLAFVTGKVDSAHIYWNHTTGRFAAWPL